MKSIIIISLTIVLSACVGMPAVSSYYVGNGNLQYFLRASELKSRDGSRLALDFSYRRIQGADTPVIVNGSFYPALGTPLELPQVTFYRDGSNAVHELGQVNLLFLEKKAGHLRFTGKISERSFLDLVNEEGWGVILQLSSDLRIEFPSSEDFRNHLAELRAEL